MLVALALALSACTTASEQPEDSADPADDVAAPLTSERGGAEPPSRPSPAAPPDAGADGVDDTDGPDEIAVPVAEPPPVPASREQLEADAGSLLAGLLERRDGEQVAVLVVDEFGREVIAHDADVPVLPASTLKVVTAAAALVTFGPQARFSTRLEATGPVDADGVLQGDLVLVGTGDPVLATPEYGRWIYPARPRTPFEDLAEQLVAAGVTSVAGDVVGVVERFDGPLVASGWPDRYFNSFDARFADGLAVDAGVRTIVSYPEPDDDDEDNGDGENGDGENGDNGDDADGDNGDGEDAEPVGPPDVRIEHTREPADHAVAELVRLLEEHDIEVAGDSRVGEPGGQTTGRLAVVSSPPLEEILRFAVQRSDNQVTDAIFRAVGRQRTGTGSFASGERALKQVLDGLGVDHDGAVFADGSGLSRDDRATARLLVDVDRSMYASRHALNWASLMAVMGESGTLESRLTSTIARGRFLGKTGTLRDVTALSGAVIGEDGRSYHLAVIANADGQARWLSRTFVDELIVLLAADLQGCDVPPVHAVESDDDAGSGNWPLGRPPVSVSC